VRYFSSWLWVIVASSWTLVPTAVTADQPVPPKDRFDLYLLVGQSNMAGRGKVTAADQTPVERVLSLNASDQWQPAIDPLHDDKPKVVGVGLGRTFAIEIANTSPEKTIGLIPCAVGGSPIDAWQPGVHYKPTDSYPWDDAIRRTKLATQVGTLRGILWHQGESDSSPALSSTYEAKLHDLINRFRTELVAQDVPFIAGQLGQFEGRPWGEAKLTIDRALQSLPHKVALTAFVSSTGLVDGGDKIHFDADSYREFGKRYARAYRQVHATTPSP